MADEIKPKTKVSRPEDEFFNSIKGKHVGIFLMDGQEKLGRLVWVDKFSLGLECEQPGGLKPVRTSDPLAQIPLPRVVMLFYKHSISRIYPLTL